MADEDVIGGQGEEAPAQEIAVEAVQDGAVDTGSVDAAVETGEADAGTSVAPDFTSIETLDALFEMAPHLREQAEERIRERENAGANRERARLQREAGKKENVTRNVNEFLKANGLDGALEDTSRLAYLYDLAAANAAHELVTVLPEAVLNGYQVPVEAREKAIDARERGDWDGYLRHLISGAAEAELAKQRADDEKRITAEVNKRLAAEIKARGIEAAPKREGAPPIPSGASPVTGPTPSEYAAASPSQRAEWRRQGVEPAVT